MKLKEYRKKIDWTQAEAAKCLGITTIYYSDVERFVYKPSRILADKIIKWSNGKISYKDLWEKKE